jgi:hypothetical protein
MDIVFERPSRMEHIKYMGSYIDYNYIERELDLLGTSDCGRILGVDGVKKDYYTTKYQLTDDTQVKVYRVNVSSENAGLVYALNCSYVLHGLFVYECDVDDSVERRIQEQRSTLFDRPICIIYPYDRHGRLRRGIAIWEYDPAMTKGEFIRRLKRDSSTTPTYTSSESPPARLMMIGEYGNRIPYNYVPSKAHPPTARDSRR